MIILTLDVILLCRFQCVQMPNKVLESVSIIDTPGILTAAKQKLSRGDLISFSVSGRAVESKCLHILSLYF